MMLGPSLLFELYHGDKPRSGHMQEAQLTLTWGKVHGDAVLVGESPEDLFPADPAVGEVDRFG
jgi:hypothetical protein